MSSWFEVFNILNHLIKVKEVKIGINTLINSIYDEIGHKIYIFS